MGGAVPKGGVGAGRLCRRRFGLVVGEGGARVREQSGDAGG